MYKSLAITKSLAARILIILVPLSYLLFYLLQGKILLLGNTDHVDAQLPSLFAAKDALALGQWPWWNPYIFNGTPLWGSTGVLLWYPLTWIELLAPRLITLQVSTAITWLQYFGIFLAGFLYFRVLIGDERWASFSALAYGFSISVAYGLAVGNAYLPIYVFLPLTLYFLHSNDQRSLRGNVVGLTISIFLLITGGFLQLLVYAMTILGSYTLFLAYQSNSRKEAFYLIKIFVISLFIALLLSAPSWLPVLYMAKLVSRVTTGNISWQSILHGDAVTPVNTLLRLFLPNGFGFDMQNPFSYVETAVSFCGVSSLFLAGMAVVHKPGKLTYYWAGIVMVILLLCYTELVILQSFVFGGVEILYGRLLYLLPLGLASLAGIGGSSLSESRISKWWLWILNPFTILLGIVLFSNLGVLSRIVIDIQSLAQQIIKTLTIPLLKSTKLLGFELLRALMIILALVLLALFLNRQKIHLFWIAGVFLLLLEVVPSTYLMDRIQLNPLMIRPSQPFFAFDNIKAPLPFSSSDLEMYRIIVTEEIPSRRANDAPPFAKEANQGSIYTYQSPWGYANGYSAYLAMLVHFTGAIDFDSKCKSGGLINGEPDTSANAIREVIFDPLCHPRLSDLMSVGAVIKAGKDWEVIADDRSEALPRASLFYDYEVIPDSVAASVRLAAPEFDIHKTLVLEKHLAFSVGPIDPKAEALITKNAPDEVTIKVDSNTPVLLLLNDAYVPGWTVAIDGQPVDINRANVAFRSVRVPGGEHTIAFRYNPPLLIITLMLQLTGMFCILGIGISDSGFSSKIFQ